MTAAPSRLGSSRYRVAATPEQRVLASDAWSRRLRADFFVESAAIAAEILHFGTPEGGPKSESVLRHRAGLN